MPEGVTDVEAPLIAEVFVVFADGDEVRWTGPSGPEPWRLDVSTGSDPMDLVCDAVTEELGEPCLLHSTSWRTDGGVVVLTFLAVVEREQVGDRSSQGVERVEIARGDAIDPPTDVGHHQVIEHAMRHLAWLAHDDASVQGALSDVWLKALAAYPAEPFRAMRGGGS